MPAVLLPADSLIGQLCKLRRMGAEPTSQSRPLRIIQQVHDAITLSGIDAVQIGSGCAPLSLCTGVIDDSKDAAESQKALHVQAIDVRRRSAARRHSCGDRRAVLSSFASQAQEHCVLQSTGDTARAPMTSLRQLQWCRANDMDARQLVQTSMPTAPVQRPMPQ